MLLVSSPPEVIHACSQSSPFLPLVNLDYTLKFKLKGASFLSVIYEASPFLSN